MIGPNYFSLEKFFAKLLEENFSIEKFFSSTLIKDENQQVSDSNKWSHPENLI
jgi:hypothetical protein